MKFLSTLVLALSVGLAAVSFDAEAKRLGGSKSVGMQRNAVTQKAPDASPPAAAAPTAAAGAAGAASSAGRSKWLGPIAGLAAGLGLAALASHLGFGEELANMMMIGLLVMAVLMVIGFVMRKRAAAAAGMGAGRMQYAGAGAGAPGGGMRPAYEVQQPAGSMIGSALGGTAASSAANIPADFDVNGFVRNAKVQFIRLQAANDAGNLDDIRQFTTPEMFAEIKMDFSDRQGAAQQTEVERLDADVIEVVEEAQRYIVSVRFTGTIREEAGAQAQPFDEVWHLEKPRQGSGGWVLAGIQQMQ